MCIGIANQEIAQQPVDQGEAVERGAGTECINLRKQLVETRPSIALVFLIRQGSGELAHVQLVQAPYFPAFRDAVVARDQQHGFRISQHGRCWSVQTECCSKAQTERFIEHRVREFRLGLKCGFENVRRWRTMLRQPQFLAVEAHGNLVLRTCHRQAQSAVRLQQRDVCAQACQILAQSGTRVRCVFRPWRVRALLAIRYDLERASAFAAEGFEQAKYIPARQPAQFAKRIEQIAFGQKVGEEEQHLLAAPGFLTQSQARRKCVRADAREPFGVVGEFEFALDLA